MKKAEKIKIYESIFHHLQYCMVSGNDERIREILQVISDWSYAHRAGNGELTDSEIKRNINRQVTRMGNFFTAGISEGEQK
jgi:hypothetical protein